MDSSALCSWLEPTVVNCGSPCSSVRAPVASTSQGALAQDAKLAKVRSDQGVLKLC